MSEEFEVGIIGAGPGGYAAALRAAQRGARVLLVEREQVGGTCLNWGCIPTKALLATAELGEKIQQAAEFGLRLTGSVEFDWAAMQARQRGLVQRLRRGVEYLLRARGVTLLRGQGQLGGPHEIAVTTDTGEERFPVRSLILAPGSQPLRPPLPGVQTEGVFTSRDLLQLDTLPDRLVVLGAGPVGMEFAHLFQTLGVAVTVLEMLPRILPAEDETIVAELTRLFRRRGMKLFTAVSVQRIRAGAHGLVVHYTQKGEEREVEAEVVLLAVGRQANIENLGLEEVGVRVKQGQIAVDEHLRTNVPHIYAVGDVLRGAGDAHTALAEGLAAAENALGARVKVDYCSLPNCIFTHPPIARVGLTEAQARAQGYAVQVGTFLYRNSGQALALNEGEGLVKVVRDAQTDHLLGVHILGAQAPSLIGEAVLALRLGATGKLLARTVHAHPTLPEVFAEAVLDSLGLALHQVGSRP